MLRSATLAAMVFLSACTSLSTSADVSTSASDVAVAGIPYELPMIQYELKVTRTLTQCVDPDTKAEHVKFLMTAEATPHFVSGETYVMDYRKLASWTKVTSLGVEYHEGTSLLKSLNAAADDRTGEIIAGALKTAVGVASLAGGIPLPAAAADPSGGKRNPASMLVCAPNTPALLTALETATAELKQKTANLEGATSKVNELAERVAALSDADKTELRKRVDAQREALQTQTKAQTKLDKAKDALSAVSTVRWPREFSGTDDAISPSDVDLRKLAALVATKGWANGPNGADNPCEAEVTKCLETKLSIYAKLDRLGMAASETADEGTRAAGTKSPEIVSAGKAPQPGVFLRPPVQGRLLVCGSVEALDCSDAGPRLLLRSDEARIPQLGTLRFLPFSNQAFQNNALSLTVAKSGDIQKVEYKDTESIAENIATTTSAAVAELRGYADARRNAETAADKKADDLIKAERAEELAVLDQEIQRLQKQKTLDDLQRPAEVTPLAATQTQTQEVNARVALLQALLAEREAQKKLAE